MLNFFSDYPEGYNLTILQTNFIKATKKENGKWTEPVLLLVAKDNNTGKKKIMKKGKQLVRKENKDRNRRP